MSPQKYMSYFDYNGSRLYYEECGVGDPLLLLHGNTASGKLFLPIMPLLSARYHLLVPDFLGCGKSDRIRVWPADLWFEWSRQAVALCRFKDIKKINVIGCSGGAIAAINMALENPEMVNAVVADSFEGLCADAGITEKICVGRNLAKQNVDFRAMLKAMHGEDWESVVDADTQAIVCHAQKIGNYFHNPINALSVRLLLTGSREDEMFPQGHYDKLFGSICSNTSLAISHIFEHGNHPAMLSNVEEFISLCESFFADTNFQCKQ